MKLDNNIKNIVFKKYNKTLMIMKMSTLLMLINTFSLLATGNGYSQDMDISLKLEKNYTIENVIAEVEKTTDYVFIYNEDVIPILKKEVNINLDGQSLDEIINQLIKGTVLSYRLSSKQITLFKDKSKQVYTQISSLIPLEAQQSIGKTITGKVLDSSGEPLPGVTIIVKGTSKGTTSDIDGNFVLSDVPENATLQFSFVGMKMQEIQVGSQLRIEVVMDEEAVGLAEVVAIGYGTRIKSELTGSVATITGEKIENVSSGNTIKNLQGRVPGLIINDRGGDVGLGSQMEIFVRGKSTWGDNSPLVVIDGVPRTLDDMRFIAQDDIESISVLKDASAAIYGAAAANGVIVIVTKRGKKGIKPTIQFNSSFGLSYFSRVLNLMDSYQYAQYENEAYQRAGMSPLFSNTDLEMFKSGEDLYTHPNTDWFRESYQAISPQNRQSLTLSGGSDNIQYYIGGEYLDQESHYGVGEFGSKRYNIRSNIDATISKILKLGADVSFRLIDQLSPSSSGGVDNRVGRSLPIDAAYWPNGLPAYGGELGNNPALMGTKLGGYNDQENFDFRSKFSFDLNLDFLTDGLSLDGYFSYDRTNSKSKNLRLPFIVYQYAKGEFIEAFGHGGSSNKPLTEGRNDSNSKLSHIKVKYMNSFGDHYINAFLAYEQVEGRYSTMGGFRKDIYTAQLPELNLGIEDGRSVSGISGESGKINYFGSLSYNYKSRYLFDFTIRRDGSFNFPPTKRFGTFPGISIGWNITEESFFPKTNFIDNLKFRTSIAKMGNDKVGQFQYLATYAPLSYYIFGESRNYYSGLREQTFPNPNITWESSRTANVGLDLTMFNQKFYFEIDYFQERRYDILRKRTAAIPDYAALTLPDENIGETKNKGIELLFTYSNNIGDFNYNLGGNFTFNRNKVVYLSEAKDIPEWQRLEGYPIDSYLVYKLVGNGVVNTQDELVNYPHRSGVQLGDLHLLDYNNDGYVNVEDQVRVFSSPRPEIQFGFNTGVEYKGFEVILFWQGQARAKTFLRFRDTGNKPSYLFDRRWTADNPTSNYPAAYSQVNQSWNEPSEYHLKDATFLKLKNVEVSYNFNNILGLPDVFKRLRVYVNATNIFTIARGDLKHFDPEIINDLGRYHPQMSTVSAGLNVTIN